MTMSGITMPMASTATAGMMAACRQGASTSRDAATKRSSAGMRRTLAAVGLEAGETVEAGVVLGPVGRQAFGALLLRSQPQQVAVADERHDGHAVATRVADALDVDGDDGARRWVRRMA